MMRADLLQRPIACISSYKNGLKIAVRLNSTAEEYLAKAEYPPIVDTTIPESQTKKWNWHKKIARLETYEQKVLELNMPKYYGFWSCILKDKEFQPNGLPFLKFVTRTQIVDSLPEQYYADVADSAEQIAEMLAPHVEALIAMHFHSGVSRFQGSTDQAALQDFLHGLHRLLSCSIASSFTTSPQPRILGWWLAGGLQNWGTDRPEWMHLAKEDREKKLFARNLHEDWEEPFMGDFCMRAESSAIFGVREAHGLPPVEERILPSLQENLPQEAVERPSVAQKEDKFPANFSYYDRDEDLQDDRLHPKVYGYKFSHKRASLVPGFWSGERHGQWRLFYHLQTDAGEECDGQGVEGEDALRQRLVIAGHAQGLAQATIMGFSPVTELTLPLVHHNIVTDGRMFNISLHQLNTVALHSDNTVYNPATNKLWLSPPAALFEAVDDKGRVQGLNKGLLARLAGLYAKQTAAREDETPYLGQCKHLWNFPAPARYKDIFRNHFLYKVSGRKHRYNKPEIYLWEKMYKLDFATRPQDAKKKFYEGHVRKRLPSDRTGEDFNPKDLRPVRTCTKKKNYPRFLIWPPKINTEKLCVENYKIYKNYYWYR